MAMTEQKKRLLREAISEVASIDLSIEEILACLEDEPTIGDGGVAEAVVTMQNIVALLRHRLEEKEGE